MERIVGRVREQRTLATVWDAPDAEFVAIYGRRRVGKTHLIREYFQPRARAYFTVTGQKDAGPAQQLHHFKKEMERVFYDGAPLPPFRTWDDAFSLLCDAIDDWTRRNPGQPVVVFLDELPWMATPRSRLVQTIDYYWNTRLARVRALRFVVCGSAASWMLDKLIHARGGLHNRITRRIRLEPFMLAEARDFLHSRRVRLAPAQVLELFMALGGVPHHLKLVERGRSATQNVAALCFERGGALQDELPRLFASLYADAETYEQIVRALARRRGGLSRNEIIDATGLTSGGRLAKRLSALEEAGFITRLTPYGHQNKDTAHRLIDEYVWFYLKWIEKAPRGVLAHGGADYWLAQSSTPGYRAWAGYAFEGVCLKHAPQIQRALGISGLACQVGTWRFIPPSHDPSRRGAQIDLLFDRADGVVTVCEIKHADTDFCVTKSYARELRNKLDVFEAWLRRRRVRKQVSLALVVPHGLTPNAWSMDLVENVVTLEQLFE